ncbi:MAG: hypothetical protein A3G08_00545 [Candidatus Magasanikbacteria bacterium RIFCSPLOWO2_12_FULL_47_9b]|nr:MAG: hypothetical protein A3I74_01445 [Candidatus Magasanikbacteria bacterium RIFCSPLOWO2_02_FULL_47_16]OGH79897.1 MAG: hypothetical protein A3C10_01780 [Candidatus Magasanikbacteria bacterium RIFCSPHIGHO2_02_FULL_48_18]OGH83267.1 MAG: hypothetical protein A3G08_00545 [Candidatus Magasanikbacteria bacterium RIFCSPLOWO2_12_FULL_47_9b]
MTLFDVILLCLIAGFAGFGFWFGLIHTLGSLAGTVVGAFFASRFYEFFADWLVHVTGWPENISRVLMFILLFILINRLVGFLFWLIEKFFNPLTSLPFLSSMNHLLGTVFGALEGALTLGLIIYFIKQFPISPLIMGWIGNSTIAPILENMAVVLLPFIPKALKTLDDTLSGFGDVFSL